ncbi:MAG TPA: D-sedoheptulose 7-phosphate isomerase [Vicinamibacteria bacterium]|nr:D-sedoheptulose 7-phosphate isomerase [Vicinamibacteria bacterium]
MNEADIRRLAAESAALKQRFFAEKAPLLLAAGRRMAECLRGGGKVLAFGNGGSAADAQHLAAELVGRFRRERAAWSALALTTDTSVLTAVGNDLGFENVFRRQMEAHGRPGDAAVGISTSGRSPNVLAALRLARERGLVTIALTGEGGGEAKELVDHLIDVPHRDTARVQEVHGMVVHVLCQVVEEELVRG